MIKTRLLQERIALEKCWSRRTAHPGTKLDLHSNISMGQCFVTSMYLFCLFNNSSQEKSLITIHRGHVENLEGINIVNDHCWLEIKTDLHDDIIIDMTADQSNQIEKKVILGFKSLIPIDFNIKYITNKIYSENNLLMLDINTQNRFLTLLSCRNKINIFTKPHND